MYCKEEKYYNYFLRVIDTQLILKVVLISRDQYSHHQPTVNLRTI